MLISAHFCNTLPFSTYSFSGYILWTYNHAIQCILPLVSMSSPNRMETQGTDYATCTVACSLFVCSLWLIRLFLSCMLEKAVLLKVSSVPDMTVPYLIRQYYWRCHLRAVAFKRIFIFLKKGTMKVKFRI